MNKPIRVLQVLGGTSLGGAESRVMDLYRHMDRERVQFDFAVHSSKPEFFDQEIESLGGTIYRLPRFKVYNWLSYRKAWKQFFTQHQEFAAVHGHMTSTASIYLPIAKSLGVKRTMAHARSAGTDSGLKGVMTRLLRKNLWKKTDYCLACSALAGQAVYGEKAWKKGLVHVIPNAIGLEKYAYDPGMREEMRRQLGVSDRLVIGHVGRFHEAKNHGFLLEVFAAVCQKRENAVLVLVGEGGGMEAAKQKAKELGIADKVQFLGSKKNVADYYQAMDVFLFPSLYEGLPGSVLEAQASGLCCVIADTITTEVGITDLVEYASLSETPQKWADRVLAGADAKTKNRRARLEELRAAGFDVADQAQKMMNFYEKGEPLWETEPNR
ncbi:MAG: glycosyltransferase family 1 protein [Lachnospiraceae bacterium]|nr:glycosyltransferase family 1 protein [Lachnospiraceae bacterium]